LQGCRVAGLQGCRVAGLQRITLLFPAKGTFSHSDIATFLGKQAVKVLLKDQKIDLGNNIQLDFNIPKNFSVHVNRA
ncbi:hypothetical protein, partial [Pectobacterium versatile]|uniref:hypothetical protein n=1 Tax=Pectobacterium versatile TaxID=2488639 RepID=UPI001B399239